MNNLKLSLLYTNYGPYHFARLEAFHELCCQKGWQAIGVEFARVERTYDWRANFDKLPCEFVCLNPDGVLEEIPFLKLVRQVFTCLYKLNPDVVIVAGYFDPGMLAALFWAKVHRKKVICLSESKDDDFLRIQWKEFVKKTIISNYDAAFVAGKPHARYFHKLGFDKNAIFCGHNAVDNKVYHPDDIAKLPHPLLNISYFLSINRFVPKKNLITLIKAYAKYYETVPENAWHLVLCGDGEMRLEIEALIDKLHLTNVIHLTGFLQQHDLLPYFAHAQSFVHASTTEQWGLVVNEAMASSLPVLVSNRCGCFEDLIIEGVNGFGFNPENQEQLTELMLKMSSGEINLKTMGQLSLEHIQKYSPDYFAHGLQQAIEYALSH
ncbi:glycosyltransferase family 4 protein [Synechocystis salina]|uniref:Glycosyltransferase n=1 Tax=Synechocystis salina LEGE 00031 TaxID=1828736 RepID=A0ABR9VRU1_9SYNC|nr:glycosyltransferase [Synechocystis salina]MBE9241023.1 glycosyltransferase [Synechocystis salina LEGE 00041]MBE9254071.1 glycosyltransferase [Synechocystis salina LEGE 00031]